MNVPVERSQLMEQYFSVWGESICQVLSQVANGSFESELMSNGIQPAEGEWVCFEAGKSMHGSQAFHVSPGDAVRLAQMLLAEPLDEKATLSSDHRDALAELFRQFSGVMSINLKARNGTESEFRFTGTNAPTWELAQQARMQLVGKGLSPLEVRIFCDADLAGSLSVSQETPAPPAPGVTQNVAADRNLDMFLDVNLDATLRFGERMMPLREILELGTGAVIELDREVQDPAELLVGGRVIARGEVVIVGGNYGLRVTEVVAHDRRLESASFAC